MADTPPWDFLASQLFALEDLEAAADMTLRDVATTMWWLASVEKHDAPAFALAAAAGRRLLCPESTGPPALQATSSLAWATAKLELRGDVLVTLLVQQALALEPNPQAMANISWALAKLVAAGEKWLGAAAPQVIARISELQAQNLSNAAQRSAIVASKNEELMGAIAGEGERQLSGGLVDVQFAANMAWSFAKLRYKDSTSEAFLLQGLAQLAALDARATANTVWAVAMSGRRSFAVSTVRGTTGMVKSEGVLMVGLRVSSGGTTGTVQGYDRNSTRVRLVVRGYDWFGAGAKASNVSAHQELAQLALGQGAVDWVHLCRHNLGHCMPAWFAQHSCISHTLVPYQSYPCTVPVVRGKYLATYQHCPYTVPIKSLVVPHVSQASGA